MDSVFHGNAELPSRLLRRLNRAVDRYSEIRQSSSGYTELGRTVALVRAEDRDPYLEDRSSPVMRARLNFMLEPKSPILLFWGCCMGLAILYTIFLIPLELAFVRVPGNQEALHSLNVMADLVFIIDFLLQFNTAIEVERSDSFFTVVITDRKTIARRYCSGGCLPDFFGALPCSSLITHLNRVSSWAKTLQLLVQFMRVSRVPRLHREREIGRQIMKDTLHHSQLVLIGFLIWGVIFMHFLACIWASVGQMPGETVTWVQSYSDAHPHLMDDSVESLYIVSFYWAVTTVTSVGYGDVTPTNRYEVGMCTLLMMVGALAWAFLFGHIVDMVDKLGNADASYHSMMQSMEAIMQKRQVPPDTQAKVRTFFENHAELHKLASCTSLIADLSPRLRGEVMFGFAKRVLQNIWYFQGRYACSQRFLVAVAHHLAPRIFTADEAISIPQTLCMVRKGLIFHSGLLLGKNDTLGDQMILNNPQLCETLPALSLTVVQLLTLSRRNLNLVLDEEDLWDDARVIRRAVCRLAVTRGIILAGRRSRAEQAGLKGNAMLSLLCHRWTKGEWLLNMIVCAKFGNIPVPPKVYLDSQSARGSARIPSKGVGPSSLSEALAKDKVKSTRKPSSLLILHPKESSDGLKTDVLKAQSPCVSTRPPSSNVDSISLSPKRPDSDPNLPEGKMDSIPLTDVSLTSIPEGLQCHLESNGVGGDLELDNNYLAYRMLHMESRMKQLEQQVATMTDQMEDGFSKVLEQLSTTSD